MTSNTPASTVDIPAYLARIGYSGSLNPDAETLRGLHRAHMLSVPFENLDIGLGRRIRCDEGDAIRKIVGRHRGGFCYEMNGAFGALLRAIGFRVTLLSARVAREDGTSSPEFDHLALRVDLDEPWLADVGFGDSFIEPLPLVAGSEKEEQGRKFRLVSEGDVMHVQRTEPDGTWKAQYSFALTPRRLEEFAPMCHYHQTSPESPFTRKKVCSLATIEGRVTLSENRLIITRNGTREERMLTSESEREAVLRDYFGVVL